MRPTNPLKTSLWHLSKLFLVHLCLLHKDAHEQNYTISLLLWWRLSMCPHHVAFEDMETISKFPKLHEVTYNLIIVTITCS